MAILEVEHICKSFEKTEVLKDISFSLEEGQVLSIIGSSGSGKTTLLRCLNFLERPDRGVIRVCGETLYDSENPTSMQDSEIRKKRLHFGLVFQSFNLFPQYSALENVMLPMEFKKMPKKEARIRAQKLLQRVGLEERIHGQFPKMMSGGEQQRVAIARAVATGGEILLADEPTGNLDSENEKKIVELLKKLAHEDGYTVIVITHNQSVAEETDHIFRMKDGHMDQLR